MMQITAVTRPNIILKKNQKLKIDYNFASYTMTIVSMNYSSEIMDDKSVFDLLLRASFQPYIVRARVHRRTTA